MSSVDLTLGEHEGRISALEQGQQRTADDKNDTDSLIREIYADVKDLKNRATCSSPNECLALRDSLAVHDRRIHVLELKDAEVMGKKTILISIVILIGWGINAAIAWFHK